MKQKVESPNAADLANLDAKREWVRGHYSDSAKSEYGPLAGKLRLLDTIIREKWIGPDETLKLQCLGVTFGDALSQELGMHWVAVEDEYGRDPALSLQGTSILLFPLTMISKRIERGEDVQVHSLFKNICDSVENARREGA